MTTTAAPALSPEAAEILDLALDGQQPSPWTKITPNRWGGFDVRTSGSGLIRVTRDDCTWTVRLMTLNEVERGAQTFTGVFAAPGVIAGTVRDLL